MIACKKERATIKTAREKNALKKEQTA